MCCKQKTALSRWGYFLGLVAMTMLLTAFVSGSWIYTKEPLPLEKLPIRTTISFKIGLWRVCPTVKRINSTIHVSSPSCILVKYSRWQDIQNTDLGISWTPLDFAQMFISRMRSCTVLCSLAVILLVLAAFFGLLGHCNNDNKTIIACGLFLLGGLSLGCGLVSFVAALTQTLSEIYEYHSDGPSGPDYDYRYGWCFFVASIALVLSYCSSALSFIGYLHRYTSIDEMVCKMVPGGERKIREHQISTEYLIRHTKTRPTYEPVGAEQQMTLEQFEVDERGPILSKTPPDVCTTNRCQDFATSSELSSAGTLEINYCSSGATCTTHNQQAGGLAGQTIPITIKNRNFVSPLAFSGVPASKYGTLPGTTLHQGFLGVADLGSSSSNSSSGYCGKSKTLQHPKTKKVHKPESFFVPDANFDGFGKQRTNSALNYSGSAV